jgi:hypothetical protein
MVEAFQTELNLMSENGVNVQIYRTKDAICYCCVDASDTESSLSSDSNNGGEISFRDGIASPINYSFTDKDHGDGRQLPSIDSLCSFGRPNMQALLQSWSKKHETSSNLAIGVCGPQTMIREVRGIARASSTPSQLIHCFSETFC